MWLLKKPLFVFTTQKHCFRPSSVTSWQPFHLSPAADVLSQFPPVKPEHGHCPCHHQDCVSVSPHSGAAQTTLSILCAVEEQHRSSRCLPHEGCWTFTLMEPVVGESDAQMVELLEIMWVLPPFEAAVMKPCDLARAARLDQNTVDPRCGEVIRNRETQRGFCEQVGVQHMWFLTDLKQFTVYSLLKCVVAASVCSQWAPQRSRTCLREITHWDHFTSHHMQLF